MIDWLNDNQGAALGIAAAVQATATIVLVVVTIVYVLMTAKQADASVKMADEMREQRLSGSQALILLEGGDSTTYESQANVRLRLRNEGNGPAMRVKRVVKHPNLFSATGEDVRDWPDIVEPMCDDGFVLARQLSDQPVPGTVRVEWFDIHHRPRWCQLPFTAWSQGGQVSVEWGQLELSSSEGGVNHDS